MGHRAVLFDVNHTLLSIANESAVQESAIGVLYEEVCRRTRLSMDERDFREAYDRAWWARKSSSYDTYEEVRYEEIVISTLSEFGLGFDNNELEDILQIYMKPIYEASSVVEGMDEILEWLFVLGIRLGLLTNYKYASGMRRLLTLNDLVRRFDAIVVSSEVGWKKPSVNIYKCAAELLQVPFLECIFVANEEEKDLWQASNLGMTTILFTPVARDDRDVLHDQDVALMLRQRLTGKVSYRASTPVELRRQLEGLLAG